MKSYDEERLLERLHPLAHCHYQFHFSLVKQLGATD